MPGRSQRFSRPLAILAGAVALASLPARGASAQTTVSAEAGLDRLYRSQRWLPVAVQLTNVGAPAKVEVRARFSAGLESTSEYRLAERVLQNNANELHTLYMRSPVSYGSQQVTVELYRDGRLLNTVKPPLTFVSDNDRLIVAIGGPEFTAAMNIVSTATLSPQQLAALGNSRYSSGQPGKISVGGLSPARVPDRWQGLEAADVVALGPVSERDLRPEQLSAIRDYVLNGGTLVIVGGVNANRLTTPFFKEILPATVTGAGTATAGRDLWDSEPQPTGSTIPYCIATRKPDTEVQGRLGSGPLAVIGSKGAGRVVFLSADPTMPPLKEWSGTVGIWKDMFLIPHEASVVRAVSRDSDYDPNTAGFNGGSPSGGSRLADAPYSIPQLDIPAFYIIALFLLAYIIVLVPVNYFFLKARDKKEYAWLTTPAIVLVFSARAYLIGYGFKGGRTLVVKVGVVEAFAGQDTAANVCYSGLFSPAKRGYDVQLASAPTGGSDAPTTLFSDAAASERGVGMRLVQDETQRVDDFAVDMWAMRVLKSEGMTRIGSGFGGRLTRRGKDLQGTVANGSPYGLEDCQLIVGTQAFPVGNLAAGGKLPISVTAAPTAAAGGPLPASLVNGIVGNSETARMRRAALAPLTSGAYYARGNWKPSARPMLVGWVKDPVAPLQIDGRTPRELAATLMVVHLD